MDEIANMGYDCEREFCFLSDDTIYSLSPLPVIDLEPSELSEKNILGQIWSPIKRKRKQKWKIRLDQI